MATEDMDKNKFIIQCKVSPVVCPSLLVQVLVPVEWGFLITLLLHLCTVLWTPNGWVQVLVKRRSLVSVLQKYSYLEFGVSRTMPTILID